MSLQNLLFVFIGGGAGSVLRFLISWLVKSQFATRLPLATFAANLLSVIVLSLVYMYIHNRAAASDTLRLLLIAGFCGGLSTFSTFSFETFELFKRGESVWAWSNIIFNNAFCIALLFIMIKDSAVK